MSILISMYISNLFFFFLYATFGLLFGCYIIVLRRYFCFCWVYFYSIVKPGKSFVKIGFRLQIDLFVFHCVPIKNEKRKWKFRGWQKSHSMKFIRKIIQKTGHDWW